MPDTRLDGAVQALDHQVHDVIERPLIVKIVFDSRVVCVVVRYEDAMFN